MIQKKILFITGAGASVDFGFPSGQGLIDKILEKKWDPLDHEKIGVVINKEDFTNYQQKIRLSNTPSIDIFIANNSNYEILSKSLIANIIGQQEKQAFGKIFQNSWLRYIWHKMIEGCRSFKEFQTNNAQFVTFNYDRILEVFFLHSIANFFGITNKHESYSNILKTVPIIHVFGKVGNHQIENPNVYRNFDNTLGTYQSWKNVGQELKTIYETTQSESYRLIQENINEADEIYFIGFGYNTFNLNLLGIKDWSEEKHISGSRYYMSDAEIEDINFLNNNKLKNLKFKPEYKNYEFLKNEVRFFAKGENVR